MPQTPSRSNNYQVSLDTPLLASIWNAVMLDLVERVQVGESAAASLETAIDALEAQLLQLVAENVAGDIQAARDALTQLLLDIAAAEDQIAALVAGGIPAVNITIAAIPGIAATNLQAALAEVVADTDAKLATVPSKGSVIALAIALG